MDALRFAIVTFDRVFDTTPKQDVLTLEELTAGLMRFELRPDLLQSIERDLARIEAAWRHFQRGEGYAGKNYSALLRAQRQGGDPAAAYAQLRADALGRAKIDLRLWAPACYRPGGRRSSENVVHLSCLVLDFDQGTPISEAQARFEPWYHVVHTTWSHKQEFPKFRLILPLADPVPAEVWRPLWTWANERSGLTVDPAMKSEGANYAVPVVPNASWPRFSAVHVAKLLHPLAEGLVPRSAAPAPQPPVHAPSHFRGGLPKHDYLDTWTPDATAVVEDDWDVDAAFDELFEGSDSCNGPEVAPDLLSPVHREGPVVALVGRTDSLPRSPDE